MLCAGLEISVQCPKCDDWVPLNGPWLRIHCDKCQSAFELKPRFWFHLFRDLYAEAGFHLEDGQGYNAEAAERYQARILYGRQRPTCVGCGEPFEPRRDVNAAYMHECPTCRAATAVVLPPAWLADALTPPRVLVNAEVQEETAEGAEGSVPDPATAVDPVAFTCPQCGGSLMVDGRDRLIPCEFCGANVYLPDDLWFRLHPARTKARWFVVFGAITGDRVSSQPSFIRRTSPYIYKMYQRD
ncbi:MAG: hypothetical protein PVH29_09400 [Candidatus Zixiibacteriota bacterium]|jgi:hypothetical protein